MPTEYEKPKQLSLAEAARRVQALPGPGFAHDDLTIMLAQCAHSGAQLLIDQLAHQYRQVHGSEVFPAPVWNALRIHAYHYLAEICEDTAKQLRSLKESGARLDG